jgi:hypothetical protein
MACSSTTLLITVFAKSSWFGRSWSVKMHCQSTLSCLMAMVSLTSVADHAVWTPHVVLSFMWHMLARVKRTTRCCCLHPLHSLSAFSRSRRRKDRVPLPSELHHHLALSPPHHCRLQLANSFSILLSTSSTKLQGQASHGDGEFTALVLPGVTVTMTPWPMATPSERNTTVSTVVLAPSRGMHVAKHPRCPRQP